MLAENSPERTTVDEETLVAGLRYFHQVSPNTTSLLRYEVNPLTCLVKRS